jgi:hypothetical protein
LERNPSLDPGVACPEGKRPDSHNATAAPHNGTAVSTGPPQRSTADAPRPERTWAPFRSLRRLRPTRGRPGGKGELLEALEADALLLREENAHLRTKLERPADAGHVMERLRALSSSGPTEDQRADDAWHLFTEALVMRNSVMEICREIGEVMAGLERRLSFLEPLDAGHSRGSAESNNGGLAAVVQLNGQLKEESHP